MQNVPISSSSFFIPGSFGPNYTTFYKERLDADCDSLLVTAEELSVSSPPRLGGVFLLSLSIANQSSLFLRPDNFYSTPCPYQELSRSSLPMFWESDDETKLTDTPISLISLHDITDNITKYKIVIVST